MTPNKEIEILLAASALAFLLPQANFASADVLQDLGSPSSSDSQAEPAHDSPGQQWNWHIQNTDIIQYHPRFPARYSGPNSLHVYNEAKETVSLDLMAGARLWSGAEFHLDGMMWQGYGLSDARGIDGFPNGEAFRLGTKTPNVTFSRAFIRQTIGLGGDTEIVEDDQLQLRGTRDVARVTLTAGKMNVKDIFDYNAYANDPRTQFMNWSLMANPAWDYPADALGYITGFAAELNEPTWAVRYGFFQMPRVSNGVGLDTSLLRAWGMVAEFEHRHSFRGHPGAVRIMSYLNHAHMGSYQEAVENPGRPADIVATREYRSKYGFGLNLEQEIIKNVGAFTRIGWSDGETEGWVFNDVDRAITGGLSIKGNWWTRPNDVFGIAGMLDGVSRVHREFLTAGGTGILAGDGGLSYGWEKILEIYYDFQICKAVHGALDYQFVSNPAFNRDRGPVSIIGARLHWGF